MPETVEDLNGDPRQHDVGGSRHGQLSDDSPGHQSSAPQTVRNQLEIVIVVRPGCRSRLDHAELEGFAGCPHRAGRSLRPFGAARAAGVRAARAPLIFIGETHTYAHPEWAEALIKAHAGPWAAVVPGFGNANPVGALSWSLFLLDYGLWLHMMPARETVMAPTHNVAYKRQVLLDLGERARQRVDAWRPTR